MLKLFYSTSSAGGFFSRPWRTKKASPEGEAKRFFDQALGVTRNRAARVLATVDMVLMKMSRATPTTSLRVSPTVSPVTAALWAGVPLP